MIMKNIKGKKLFILILSTCMLFGCMSPAIAKTIQLRFSTPYPTMQSVTEKTIIPWINKINKAGKGKVNIKLYPAGALGKVTVQYDLAEKGIADISYHTAVYTPGRFPMTEVFSLPFMVPSAQITSEAMWETFMQEPKFREEYSKVKVLALFCTNGAHFYSVKPINNLSDFKSMKISTSNPSANKALKFWGAVPVSMPVTEMYQSLERNVIEGTVLTSEAVGVFKLDEVAKYATMADIITWPMMIVMNKDRWESLPQDVKELIDSTTGLSMSSSAGRDFDVADGPFRARAIKKGTQEITLSPADLKKMKDSTLPLRDEWVKNMEAKGYPAQQILNTALGFIKKK